MTRSGLLALAIAASLHAQSRTPVVLLNGYQSGCPGTGSSVTAFGKLQNLLEAEGVRVYFFDSCSLAGSGSNRPSIEELGQAFGRFLETIPETRVDIVAHSTGGLIMRAYLSGMLPSGQFDPPSDTRIRKAVLMGTPHYGTLALLYYLLPETIDTQLEELLPGSGFEWRLNTSNQGSYDFRGVDTLSILGNGAGSSDGVVALTSGSLAGFIDPEKTRVIAGCHVRDMPKSICSGEGIAYIESAEQDSWNMLDSFLAGTDAWRKIGRSASEDAVLSRSGGINVTITDASGKVSRSITRIAALQGELPGNAASGVFFGDLLPVGDYRFIVSGAASSLPNAFSFRPSAGFHRSLVVKNGPKIDGISSATGKLETLSRAPGMLVAIYGAGLTDASFTAAGQPLQLLYVSDSQVNAVLPRGISGVVPFVATAPGGSYSVNLFVEEGVPALFVADGSGAALAFHSDGSPVSAAHPALLNETVTFYATGLNDSLNVQAYLGDIGSRIIEIVPASPGVSRLSLMVPAATPIGDAVPFTLAIGTHKATAVLPVRTIAGERPTNNSSEAR